MEIGLQSSNSKRSGDDTQHREIGDIDATEPQIDFKVNDENLADSGAISVLLPDDQFFEDVAFFSYNTTVPSR